jgi:hypothetical protein
MAVKFKNMFFVLMLLASFNVFSQPGISYQGIVLYPSVELPGVDKRNKARQDLKKKKKNQKNYYK